MTSTHRRILDAAVSNNAAWCERVIGTHGHRAFTTTSHWWSPDPVPPFYPNLVTLSPDDPAGQYRAIDGLLAAPPKRGWAVKDSYTTLDLHTRGFRRLFDAFWYSLSACDSASDRGLALRVIEGVDELDRWIGAFARGDPAAVPPLSAGLLRGTDTCLIAGIRRGQIVCGTALHAAAGVVGCSHVFEQAGAGGDAVACIAEAARLFPGQPIVGYGGADELERVADASPAILGPLVVWTHP